MKGSDISVLVVGGAATIVALPALWKTGVGLGNIAYSDVMASTLVAVLAHTLAPIVAVVLAATSALWVAIKELKSVSQNLSGVRNDLNRFFDELSANAKDTAIDAGFMAVLALLASLVAFQSTDDFLDHVSTIKIFAASSVAYAILKGLMLIPVRSAKLSAGLLTLTVLILSAIFLIHRHDLFHPNGAMRLLHLFADTEFPRRMVVVIIFLLSALSLLYPFSLSRWKRLWSW